MPQNSENAYIIYFQNSFKIYSKRATGYTNDTSSTQHHCKLKCTSFFLFTYTRDFLKINTTESDHKNNTSLSQDVTQRSMHEVIILRHLKNQAR